MIIKKNNSVKAEKVIICYKIKVKIKKDKEEKIRWDDNLVVWFLFINWS